MMMSAFRRPALAVVLAAVLSAAAPSPLPAAPVREEPAEVLASTGWTAAFARLAGLEDVRVLAPFDLQHPPEYELRPSDLEAVAGARLIVYAGYEVMVEKLKATAGRGQAQLIQIETRNDLQTIRPAVLKIADAAGTRQAAEGNLRELERFFADWRRELSESGAAGAPVVVHFHQRPLAAELGFDIRGVFGPAPLEPRQIVRFSAEPVRIIIDNWHNPTARPLEETLPGTPRTEFLNFPGSFGTRTLPEVLQFNRRKLKEALGP